MLEKYVREIKLDHKTREIFEIGKKSMETFAKCSAEIWEKYRGKFVAIIGDEIHSGKTIDELKQKLGDRIKLAIVIKIPYKDKIWIYEGENFEI